jgi:quercetin dioxygenase-like cupin family protein
MEYKFIQDLATEFAMPQDGILSRVLHKDEKLNVTLFGFSAGQELSTHSAPTPALLYFLQGEADLRLGGDIVQAKSGSFVYMPPMLPHGISAKAPVMMLLVQVKAQHLDGEKPTQESEIAESL